VAESYFATETPECNRIKAGVFFILIALLSAFTYFSPHIWQHGEAREALVVEDIVKNHRWVLPLRNGELPSKPILYHWMAALFALPLGFSDFIVRLPSVVAATFLAWVTYSLGAFGTNRKTGYWLSVFSYQRSNSGIRERWRESICCLPH
jgi:4-amino-4-deoxy-L-arabinose transferase-like glycosyltransferase